MSYVSPGTDVRGEKAFSSIELSLRDRVRALWLAPEALCVQPLIEEAHISPKDRTAVVSSAKKLVSAVRGKRRRAAGLDTLMREFSLSSREGVALMRLAEAALRVPDKTTLDALIRDKVGAADWASHMGLDSPWFVNATAWGLMMSGRVTSGGEDPDSGVLAKLVARGGEPFVRKGVEFAVRLLAERFVSGATIEDALWRSNDTSALGYTHSFDMLGESAINEEQVRRHLTDYVRAIHAVGTGSERRGPYLGNGVSVKLSALYPRFEDAQRERAISSLLPRLRTLASLARRYDIGFNIDAEDCDSLDMSVDILEALAFDPDLAEWNGLGCVVQAYQKRARPLVDHLIEVARASGHRLMIRLVKGAYWDSEIKRAQVQGLIDYPVFTRKAHTDVSYIACARRLLEARDVVFPQFATHNALTAATIQRLAGNQFKVGDWEFQCLHGMGEALYNEVLGKQGWARPVRIYSPVGNHARLLPYLVRRILENGANSSFVSQLVDQNLPLEKLLADPVAETERHHGVPHSLIGLPRDLYQPERCNSMGVDFGDEHAWDAVMRALEDARAQHPVAAPVLAREVAHAESFERWPVVNPADYEDQVGEVVAVSEEGIEAAFAAAVEEGAAWSAQDVAERAACLQRAADLIEQHRDALVALCIREAGKTLNASVAEVREAADFCRYYALRALELPPATMPLGVVVCISPWNFPLAIFVGQVAAALVCGNRVLAKPAEQTTLMAAEAVRLFHLAGVTSAALQLLPGRGEVVGAALVADRRVDGVMFTGSTDVAQIINRTLAARERRVPLIAETGGINAMIVDSTSLPNQVVEDVLASAFDSAGQRCSSLRVLCVQREIADEVLIMLRGAMKERVLGEGGLRTTDIGPVIDGNAASAIVSYLEKKRAEGLAVGSVGLNADCARGQFVPPTLVEINSLADIEGEVFGPVLHVLRYEAERLDELVANINTLGFGLTLGIHSRIDATVLRVVRAAKVGNIYVNRNMIGAVVGTQPFGGEGLSGTGPKAGGPLYLMRLVRGVPPLPDRWVASDAPQVFEALAAWIASGQSMVSADEAARLIEQAERYRERVLVGQRVVLPGPTGEENTLSFHPRGPVLALADDAAALIHQMLAAFACNADVVLVHSAASDALVTRLPRAVALRCSSVADWSQAPCAVVLHQGEASRATKVRAWLAAGSGPIRSLIEAEPLYDLTCLVVERCVTINTAAAGGNARLAMLEV